MFLLNNHSLSNILIVSKINSIFSYKAFTDFLKLFIRYASNEYDLNIIFRIFIK